MSHFVTAVLLPADTKDIDGAVTKLLAPYDENKEVDAYQTECYCIQSKRRDWVNEAMKAHFGYDFSHVRSTFNEMEEAGTVPKRGPFNEKTGMFENEKESQEAWKKHITPWLDKEKEFSEQAAKMEWPGDPECSECAGAGSNPSTYNPLSKWDWWVIGGRWQGYYLADYDPRNNPENFEPCVTCGGTGKRNDHFVQGKCNGCNGEGTRLKWSSDWEDEGGNIVPVGVVLDMIKSGVEKDNGGSFIPFAMVTPDGQWHEKGKMGWWACVSDEKDGDDWEAACKEIYEKYSDHIVVACDLHI